MAPYARRIMSPVWFDLTTKPQPPSLNSCYEDVTVEQISRAHNLMVALTVTTTREDHRRRGCSSVVNLGLDEIASPSGRAGVHHDTAS